MALHSHSFAQVGLFQLFITYTQRQSQPGTRFLRLPTVSGIGIKAGTGGAVRNYSYYVTGTVPVTQQAKRRFDGVGEVREPSQKRRKTVGHSTSQPSVGLQRPNQNQRGSIQTDEVPSEIQTLVGEVRSFEFEKGISFQEQVHKGIVYCDNSISYKEILYSEKREEEQQKRRENKQYLTDYLKNAHLMDDDDDSDDATDGALSYQSNIPFSQQRRILSGGDKQHILGLSNCTSVKIGRTQRKTKYSENDYGLCDSDKLFDIQKYHSRKQFFFEVVGLVKQDSNGEMEKHQDEYIHVEPRVKVVNLGSANTMLKFCSPFDTIHSALLTKNSSRVLMHGDDIIIRGENEKKGNLELTLKIKYSELHKSRLNVLKQPAANRTFSSKYACNVMSKYIECTPQIYEQVQAHNEMVSKRRDAMSNQKQEQQLAKYNGNQEQQVQELVAFVELQSQQEQKGKNLLEAQAPQTLGIGNYKEQLAKYNGNQEQLVQELMAFVELQSQQEQKGNNLLEAQASQALGIGNYKEQLANYNGNQEQLVQELVAFVELQSENVESNVPDDRSDE